MNKDLVHTKNEDLYLIVRKDYVTNQVSHATIDERKKNLVQYFVYFHLLFKGKPMTDYDNMSKLMQFLGTPNYLILHWSSNIGWEMATYMHEVVVYKISNLVQSVQFISLSCDEVTTCDQQSWVLIHAYVVGGWQRIFLLLSLQQVVDGATSNNLKCIMVDVLVLYGDLTQENIASKLITFGVDGVSVFRGVRIGVTQNPNIAIHDWCALHESLHKFGYANTF